jgi:nuclear pore complex protein Nup107
MADRVGREVDHFAETLDKFNSRLHGQDAYRTAVDLTLEYKDFASSMVKKLKKLHDAQRVNVSHTKLQSLYCSRPCHAQRW